MPIEFQDMLERKRELTIHYFGHEVVVRYWVERMTREFKEDLLRMSRSTLRLQQRLQALSLRVQAINAPEGTPEAKVEDEDAEEAIKLTIAEDRSLKRQIDKALVEVLAEWDVLKDGQPMPIDLEHMFSVPSDFEGAVILAILADSQQPGEAIGQGKLKPLPFTLRQKAKPVRSRRRRTG